MKKAESDWMSEIINNYEFKVVSTSLTVNPGYTQLWPEAPCGIYGDLNGNGLIDSCRYDMPILYKHFTEHLKLTEEQMKRADLNGDGKITTKDLGLMSFYLSRRITTFPVCNHTNRCGNGICEEGEGTCIDCTCGNGVCDPWESSDFGGGDFPTTSCPEECSVNTPICLTFKDCVSCVENRCAWCDFLSLGCCIALSDAPPSCITDKNKCQDGSTTTTLPVTTTLPGATTTTIWTTTTFTVLTTITIPGWPTTTIPVTTTVLPTITTTTLPSGQFTSTDFRCIPIPGGHRCILFNNQLGEDAIILYLFTDSKGKVVSSPAPIAKQGIGSVSSVLFCNMIQPGNYKVFWRAYRESDERLVDEVAWSKAAEVREVVC